MLRVKAVAYRAASLFVSEVASVAGDRATLASERPALGHTVGAPEARSARTGPRFFVHQSIQCRVVAPA